MSKIELEEFITRIKAMSNEEKETAYDILREELSKPAPSTEPAPIYNNMEGEW